MDKLNINTIKQYVDKLHARGESASMVKQKMASVKKFLDWAKDKGYVKEEEYKEIIKMLEGSLSFPRRRESRLKSLLKNVINRLDPRLHGDDKQQPKEKLTSNHQPLTTNL